MHFESLEHIHWFDEICRELDELYGRECFRCYDSKYKLLWRIGYKIYYKSLVKRRGG